MSWPLKTNGKKNLVINKSKSERINMKATLLTKENRQQIVLHPENEFERDIIKLFASKTTHVQLASEPQHETPAKIYLGQFYDCQGGWTRESKSQESLIIVFDKE